MPMLPLDPSRLMRTVARATWSTVIALIATIAFGAIAHAADGIAGIWWTPEHDGKIEIMVDAGVASGRLIAVERAHAGDRDARNPDPSLRARPILGLTILGGFHHEANGTWSGGTVYDPEEGRTYRGTLALDRDGRLRMRGYVGLPLFGRTEILTRVGGPAPAQSQPGEPDLAHLPR